MRLDKVISYVSVWLLGVVWGENSENMGNV